MVPPTRPGPTRPDLSPSGERETPPQASEVEPAPVASHGAEAMLRSLVAPTDADAAVAALVSETRQAAGGAPFRGTGFADRQAVQKLAEWAAATSTPPDPSASSPCADRCATSIPPARPPGPSAWIHFWDSDCSAYTVYPGP
jgi:hypothetical protein